MNFDNLISRLGMSHMPNRGPAARFGGPAQQIKPPAGAVPMGPYASGKVGAPMASTPGGMFGQARQVGARSMGTSPPRSVSQRVR